MENLRVSDLMTREVVTLGATDSVARASDLMDANHIRHLPVVNEENQLIGLVSQRDLVSRALAEIPELPQPLYREAIEAVRLEEIMTIVPETVGPDRDIREAAELLLQYKFGCLPVCENDDLVGILTETDFVKHVVAQADNA